jgi:hypothetical protein
MAVNTTDFHNWQKAGAADKLRFRKASPNLVALRDFLLKRWGGKDIGIYGVRPIRGGEAMSSHSFGAAMDWRYDNRKEGQAAIRWLIKNSKELGIQAIHDYYGGTIWRSVRSAPDKGGWKPADPDPNTGMGQAWAKWLHIETTKTDWANSTPVEKRLAP